MDTPALVVGEGTPAVFKVEHGPLGHAHGDGGVGRAGGTAYGMNMRAVNLLRRRVVSQSGSLLGTFEVMDAEDMGYKHMTDDEPAAQTERERRREAATPAAAVKSGVPPPSPVHAPGAARPAAGQPGAGARQQRAHERAHGRH